MQGVAQLARGGGHGQVGGELAGVHLHGDGKGWGDVLAAEKKKLKKTFVFGLIILLFKN